MGSIPDSLEYTDKPEVTDYSSYVTACKAVAERVRRRDEFRGDDATDLVDARYQLLNGIHEGKIHEPFSVTPEGKWSTTLLTDLKGLLEDQTGWTRNAVNTLYIALEDAGLAGQDSKAMGYLKELQEEVAMKKRSES